MMRNMKCSVCEKGGALRCKTCKIVFYCGKECQSSDHGNHKNTCKSVKKLTDIISREEETLRASSTASFFTDEKVNFWEHQETRLYMRTRTAHFNLLDDIGTEPALREAIAQGKIMLQEGRGNNPSVRLMIPSMILRLNDPGALQECYDFMKWGDVYIENYELELSQQNTQSDMCEILYGNIRDGSSDLYNVVALAIIKMRLLLQLQQFLAEYDILLEATIHTTSEIHIFGGNDGVLLSIAAFLLPGHACFALKRIEQLRVLEERLQRQVRMLLRAAERHDDRIWKIFVDPSKITPSISQEPRPSRLPGYSSRILSVAMCYMPFFSTETRDSRALRKLLVTRVGEKPNYKLTVLQGLVQVLPVMQVQVQV